MLTPIYMHTDSDSAWPADSVFYLVTADGLYLCRNHPFFQSSVRAPRWPSELAPHHPFLLSRYPKIPQAMIERVVGFFDHVAELHGSEAVVLMVWNRETSELEIVAPPQLATLNRNRWGDVYAIGVEYDSPILGPHQVLIGDIHSHVDMAAYASGVDRDDEKHRAGLHVVIGRLFREPPDIHIEAVVDGARFELDPTDVFVAYECRRPSFPDEWLSQLKLKVYGSGSQSSSNNSIVRSSNTKPAGNGNGGLKHPQPVGREVPMLPAPKDVRQEPDDNAPLDAAAAHTTHATDVRSEGDNDAIETRKQSGEETDEPR